MLAGNLFAFGPHINLNDADAFQWGEGMKYGFILLGLLFPGRPAFAVEKLVSGWSCTSVGYDANFDEQYYDGPIQLILEDAKKEALAMCLGKQCHILECLEYR